MPTYRCCVGGCNNDSRYPERQIKRSHVQELKFHYFPKDAAKRKLWTTQVAKGLVGFEPSDHKTVCSNHFAYGKPTFMYPTPSLYLVVSDMSKPSPRKRKAPACRKSLIPPTKKSETIKENSSIGVQCSLNSAFLFSDISRDADVNFFTASQNKELFKAVFELVATKAFDMHYWKGMKNTTRDFTSP